MKKYKKPVLDIVEFDNMDVVTMSDLLDSVEGDDAIHMSDVLKATDSYPTVDPTPGAHETSESTETTQDSGESTDGTDGLAPQGEDPTETGLDTDTVEPTVEPGTQVEPPSDYGELS